MVYLVGAGPGDAGLLTVRAAELLLAADVVIYDGLVSPAIRDLIPPRTEAIYAGKKRSTEFAPRNQDEINQLLIDRARAGQMVVRLKGGDPFVFGRGAEECLALTDAGVRFVVVPGVSAATAVAAYAGIPLTARDVTSTVAFATGHEAAGKPTTDVDWQALAHAGTAVLFMGLKTLADSCAHLVAAGRDPSTPAAAVYWGTTASQRTVASTLGKLANDVSAAGFVPPVLVIVGEVVALRKHVSWYESLPLFGCRILVTRDRSRNAELATNIASLGGELLSMPLTRTEAVPDAPGDAVEKAISELAEGAFDGVVFASRNAVDYFFARLHERGADARIFSGLQVACVGPATAEAARAHGVIADLVPKRSDSLGLTEEISTHTPRLGRILVPRAAAGRDELIDGLIATGAQVAPVVVYETVAIGADNAALASGVRQLERADVSAIVFYAPSQVEAFFAAVAESGRLLQSVKVGAIGNTTAQALHERGVERVFVPDRPEPAALLRAIAAAVKDGQDQ